jgi:hypothetical protein
MAILGEAKAKGSVSMPETLVVAVVTLILLAAVIIVKLVF